MHKLLKNPAVCSGEKFPKSVEADLFRSCWSCAKSPFSASIDFTFKLPGLIYLMRVKSP